MHHLQPFEQNIFHLSYPHVPLLIQMVKMQLQWQLENVMIAVLWFLLSSLDAAHN